MKEITLRSRVRRDERTPSIPCQVGFSPAADLKHALDPAAQGGSTVTVCQSATARPAVMEPAEPDLLRNFIEAGKIVPVIDRTSR